MTVMASLSVLLVHEDGVFQAKTLALHKSCSMALPGVYTSLHVASFMQSSDLTLSFVTLTATYWLVLSCCRMFEMMAQYDLLMAHPSVCSDLESDSHLMDMLKRQPTNVLRYTTAVDILAPLFDMAFFQDSIVNTLHNATYGMPLKNKLQIGVKLCATCTLQAGVHTGCICTQSICLAKCAVWCMSPRSNSCLFFTHYTFFFELLTLSHTHTVIHWFLHCHKH